MVEIDWKKLMGIQPEKFSEKEKDDLYDTVTWYTPDFNLDRKYLIHFVRILQEILKYKGEQVDSLTNELDDIAARQGKEEGSKLQQYIDEIEQLREELEYHKKIGRSSSRSPYTSSEELKREMVRLEMHNEELLGELKERETELVTVKEEAEKYVSQIATLEREKEELNRELKALQEEAAEKTSRSFRDSPELTIEKQEELTEVIRQKNKHISQLLEDIDLVEKENLSLRTKLSSVRDELDETTTHINEITAELLKLRHLNEEYEIKNSDSFDKIKGLTSQVEELVEEKSKYDKQLDEYVVMFNTKLEEWKEVISVKDEEIVQLNEEIKKLYSSGNMFVHSEGGDTNLNKKIIQQEEQINILQQELQKATEEINSSSELIEKLKKQFQAISQPADNQTNIIFLEEKIKVLEEKLKYAEEDAQAKAEEMSDLIIQIREYETGVFGLSEAMKKIKKLEKIQQRKDLQIEKLVEICNNLEIKLDNFEEQNMALRERLGLTASDEIDTSGVKLKFKKDEQLIQNLKLQLDKKEEELIKVKLKYRKIVNYLKMLPPEEIKTTPRKSEVEKDLETTKCQQEELYQKLEMVIKENDALRKGMHEILESIKKQDCIGTIEVQSLCLERLLEALDSRHVSGWYHPAMRLQAQLNSAEGKNEELRNQIRTLKSEEKKRTSELQNAYLKIQSLENDLSTPRQDEEEVKKVELKTSDFEDEVQEISIEKHDEIIQKDDKELIEKLPKKLETEVEEELKKIPLESELQELKFKLRCNKTELEKAEMTFSEERENLCSRITELESQLKDLKNTNQNIDVLKISKLNSQVVVLERKITFLKNMESTQRYTNEKLRQEMMEEEEKSLRMVLKLQNEKSKLLDKMYNLEASMLNMIPQEKFETLNKELASINTKYQHSISLALAKQEDSTGKELQFEVKLLQNEKKEILDELRKVKEKLIAAESMISEEVVTKGDFSSEISILSSKLAASEVREINEKQKSVHLEKLNDMLKCQQKEVETRGKDLLEQVTKLTEENQKYQEVERELRVKVLKYISEEERSVLIEKIDELERKYKELLLEKDNIQELFEISQGQCRAYQEWKDADKIQLASLMEQILLLQSTEDDKSTISRLSHELAMAKLLTSQLTKKNNDLKMNVTKLMERNLNLEVKVDEKRRELLKTKEKHLALEEYMYESMDEVRKLYGTAVSFHDIENIYNSKVEMTEKKKELEDKMNQLQTQIHEYESKKEEMETQLESLEDLKSAVKGDAKNLVSWHNKTTELRLKEARCRRKNEFLTGEISQLESCIKKLNEEITILEESTIEKEKEWERKQILWEEAQLEMCQLLQEKGVKKKKIELCDASTNTQNTEFLTVLKTEQNEKLKTCEWKMKELEEEVVKLQKEGKEKEEIIIMKEKLLNNLNGKSKTIELEETVYREKIENAEKEALKVTVQSLQNIIKQKEDTILRYQDLLKEGREEYSKACAKLQEELKGMNETIAAQSKAYNKLKNAVQANHFANDNIPAVVEKYITKIQELEEELRECQMNLSSVNTQAYTYQQEVEKWRNLATERLLSMEEMRQRMNGEYQREIKNYEEEVKKYQKEIEDLHQALESLRSEAAGTGEVVEEKAVSNIQQFQVKSLEQETEEIHAKSDQLSDCTFDKPRKQKSFQSTREVESLKRQLKFSRDESSRLREQIRLLQSQPPKRSRTGSSSNRSDSKSSVKEGSLTNKIKHLEELLTMSKEREKELMEINQKKLKSTEEVARWDERKKSQHTIETLSTRLKEKEAEVEVLKNKNESFRNMVYKCDRDKSVLEAQLKAAKNGPGGTNSRIEKLTAEKNQLEEEVRRLEQKLDEQMRHSGGIGAALLQEKLEVQERKLATLELASRGQTPVVEELERIKTLNSSLEKANLKLESENLSLKLKLEKEKAESKYLLDKIRQLQVCHSMTEDMRETKRLESDRTLNSLHKTIERLTEENKRLRLAQKEPRTYKAMEKVRTDLAKLREDHKILKGKYMEAVDKNIALEEEVKSCRYQIHLMEEKDLAEVLTKTNSFQMNSELSQELIELKAKLAHKNQLLSRVKSLLIKAAAKEKALLQEVTFLQNMVPKPGLHVHG